MNGTAEVYHNDGRHSRPNGWSSQKGLNLYEFLIMDFYKRYGLSGENRREELIRKIEAAVNNLTLEELEALHYDMMTKNFIND